MSTDSLSPTFSLLGEGLTSLPMFEVSERGTPTLLSSRCPSCGDFRFPPQQLCPIDNETTMSAPLGGRGRIYEVVQVVLGPPGFPTPYWVGYVDLDEGIRIFGRIEPEESAATRNTATRWRWSSRSYVSDRAGNGECVLAPLFRRRLYHAQNEVGVRLSFGSPR